MMYILLNNNMDLSVTVSEPIYRGDNLSRKITFLIPTEIGEVDMLSATVYLSYIQRDGTADIVLLNRLPDFYNGRFCQYILPITCAMTRCPGEVLMWLQIFDGTPPCPSIAKSSECTLRAMESKNMDSCISDRHLSLIYGIQRRLEDKIAETETVFDECLIETVSALDEAMAQKADNVIFNEEDGTLRLMCGSEPIGDEIIITRKIGTLTDAEINGQGELLLSFDDGSTRNLGAVTGKDGAVYVPHISARKILSFTIEDEPSAVPDPVDLNPSDEWGAVGADDKKSDYVWETM